MSIVTDIPQKSVEAGHSSTTQAIHQWLRESAGGERRLDYAMTALGWCRSLPQLADMLPAVVWQELLDHLVQTAVEVEKNNVEVSLLEADPVVHQLLAGELPLTLASLFPEIKACRQLLSAARRALSAGLVDLLDGEGLLHARHFDRLRPLLACWTRCRKLGGQWKRGCCSDEADAQYRQFVRNALRLTRRDGSHVFSDETPDPDGIATLRDAVAMVGKENDLAIASLVLPGNEKKSHRAAGEKLPKAVVHSEWATAAVLRQDWSRTAPRLTVLFPGASCRVELACGKDVLWSGDWGLDVRIDGTAVSPISDWSDICWVSDKDVDYLELEIELGEGLRVQRHFCLARKDRFLLMADAVLGSRRATIDYRGTLPLGRHAAFRGALDSHEGTLMGRKTGTIAIPLAMPEWRDAQNNVSGLRSTENTLELRQSAVGCSLFAPMFFDLDRRRVDRPLTWRRLTVGDSLAVQPADAAVGYRVATGDKQWLIYRSLTLPRNRTLLGHNLSSEMLVARFTRKGEVESLIEIE